MFFFLISLSTAVACGDGRIPGFGDCVGFVSERIRVGCPAFGSRNCYGPCSSGIMGKCLAEISTRHFSSGRDGELRRGHH